MKRKLTEKQLRRLISNYTDVCYHDITTDSRIKEDLGLSSFDIACIASEIEEKYNVHSSLLSDEGYSLATVGEVLAFLTNSK